MDHRTQGRISIKIPLKLAASYLPWPHAAVADNISPGGIHSSTYLPMLRGERILCQFRIPGVEKTFVMDAKVVHQDHGFGLRFMNSVSSNQDELLNALWDQAKQ